MVVPRTSHEGIQFDKVGNMYFIDELNGGNIDKYKPLAKLGDVKDGTADYFAAGQTSVLRVGDGNTPNATGAFSWIPITDANGAAERCSAFARAPRRAPRLGKNESSIFPGICRVRCVFCFTSSTSCGL